MFITIIYKHSDRHNSISFIGLQMYGVEIAVKGFKEYVNKNYTYERIYWDKVFVKLPMRDKIPYLQWQKENQNTVTN